MTLLLSGLVLLAAALTFVAVATVLTMSAERRLSDHDRGVDALRARVAERGRVLVNREKWEYAQRATEGAVEVGSAGVRASHEVIAEIPFAVLEQIPATKDASQTVRQVHDAAAQGVYDTISLVNKLAGKGLRRRIHRGRTKGEDAGT